MNDRMTRKSIIQPADRLQVLTQVRNQKMAASAQAYVRGSTTRFYQWLQASNRPKLPAGPDIWICGDCHVGNIGPVASTKGKITVEIRDFDQTTIGDPAHDLIRLGLSLAMAARGSDLPGVTTAHMLEHMMKGYESAFAPKPEAASSDNSSDLPQTVKLVMREAAGRSWKHLADERIEGIEPVIPLGKRFWPLTREERSAVKELCGEEPLRRLATSLRSRDDDAEIRVLDAAYWRKGCSSLGLLRLAVLIAIGSGRAERHCLMDIKEATAAAAPHSKATMPRDNAERVVSGARALSPSLGDRMIQSRLLDRSVFIRELLPQDLKIEIDRLSRDDAKSAAEFLARVVGCAHARQLDPSDCKKWLRDLQRNRSKSLDAPSWLWTSVVDLVAAHEAAYLEHCRRYALTQAA
jgi:uncharacterized protein (DUF2252 family)